MFSISNRHILYIKEKNIKAKYYYDGSGDLEISSNRKYCEPIIATESGTIYTHIKDIDEKISEYKKGLEMLKAAKKLLKKNVKELKFLKVPE